ASGGFKLGPVPAIIAGMALGFHLEGDPPRGFGWPAVVAAAAALNLLAVVTAWPVVFPSDVRRPENASRAISGFFRDAGRIWRDSDARATLLGLATLRAIVTGATGAFFAVTITDDARPLMDRIAAVFSILVWLLLGAGAGSLLAGVQRHPRRALGIVPLATTGLFVGLVLAATDTPGPVACTLLGVMGG